MPNGNGELKSAAEKVKEGLPKKEDRLSIIETRIKELEPKKDEKEAREELSKLYGEKIKLTQSESPSEPPKDFKVAEIWVKEGQLILDASPEFWMDKLRALGVLEMCKDIVKDFKQDRNKITPVKNSMLNFARNFRSKFRRR